MLVSREVLSLYSQNTKHMTQTTTIPAVKLTTNEVMSSDVFYGSLDTVVKDKSLKVIVSNHIKDVTKEYEFRVVAKCQAGFVNISDSVGTPFDVINGWAKNALMSVQVKINYENGRSLWLNVFASKGNKWYSIDRGFLEILTVGNMRSSFPDMCDMKLWELVGTKTWADKAFVQN